MKIGFPCINRGIGCTANSTFRLGNYSRERLINAILNNLECLNLILQFNVRSGLKFFRISSDIIIFVSHSIMDFPWQKFFLKKFLKIGKFIKENNMRMSMHPDQFVLINSLRDEIVEKSFRDLIWHSELFDLMELDETAKVQIHVGGVYGNKESATKRFIKNYKKLLLCVRKRLAIENDDKLFSLKDYLL